MQKLDYIKKQLYENKITAWFMYCAENNDFVFQKFINKNTSAPAVAIITQQQTFLIAHELDFENIKEFAGVKFCYKTKNERNKHIEKIFKIVGFPAVISLNYSANCDTKTDILGAGLYFDLTTKITSIYNKNKKEVKFNSAERLIYSLFDSKDEQTINRMKLAAKIADDILAEAFLKIRAGQTELQIADLAQKTFESRQPEGDIVSIDYAWGKDNCPIVLVGENFKKGGHALPSETPVNKGDTVYFDFGVSLVFNDGQKVSSDIQRMGYLLKQNETKAPAQIQKVFDTLVKAIDIGAKALKPNIKGYKVDELVRAHIIKSGYPDYNHGTGHAIGETAHGIGTTLSSRKSKQANLPVRLNGTYTIEPRISIKNGGSIEEMVCVTKDGAEFISPRQTNLYLIK